MKLKDFDSDWVSEISEDEMYNDNFNDEVLIDDAYRERQDFIRS